MLTRDRVIEIMDTKEIMEILRKRLAVIRKLMF